MTRYMVVGLGRYRGMVFCGWVFRGSYDPNWCEISGACKPLMFVHRSAAEDVIDNMGSGVAMVVPVELPEMVLA